MGRVRAKNREAEKKKKGGERFKGLWSHEAIILLSTMRTGVEGTHLIVALISAPKRPPPSVVLSSPTTKSSLGQSYNGTARIDWK